jgi:hypothetical protein
VDGFLLFLFVVVFLSDFNHYYGFGDVVVM